MNRSRAAVVAVAAALALVAVMAVPAGADGPFPMGVTSGSWITDIGTFDLGVDGPEPPCPSKVPTTDLRTDSHAWGPGTWIIGGDFSRQLQLQPSGPWYQLDFSVYGDGTYVANGSPPPDYDMVGQLFVFVDVYAISDDFCRKEDLRCSIAGLYDIVDADYHGDLPDADSGDEMVVDASTVLSGMPLVASPCSQPFVALNGTDADFDNLRLIVI